MENKKTRLKLTCQYHAKFKSNHTMYIIKALWTRVQNIMWINTCFTIQKKTLIGKIVFHLFSFIELFSTTLLFLLCLLLQKKKKKDSSDIYIFQIPKKKAIFIAQMLWLSAIKATHNNNEKWNEKFYRESKTLI